MKANNTIEFLLALTVMVSLLFATVTVVKNGKQASKEIAHTILDKSSTNSSGYRR